MKNKHHTSIFSAKAGLLGGRVRASLRVYTLGDAADPDVLFSMRLWYAAGLRQERLARGMECSPKTA
jgi:hypothetical protein